MWVSASSHLGPLEHQEILHVVLGFEVVLDLDLGVDFDLDLENHVDNFGHMPPTCQRGYLRHAPPTGWWGCTQLELQAQVLLVLLWLLSKNLRWFLFLCLFMFLDLLCFLWFQ